MVAMLDARLSGGTPEPFARREVIQPQIVSWKNGKRLTASLARA